MSNKKCERCNGTGKIPFWVDNKRKEFECPDCGASGKIKYEIR